MNKSYEELSGNGATETELQFQNNNHDANLRNDAIQGVDTRKNARSKSIYHSVMPQGESPDILIVENVESYQTNKRSNKNENYNAGDTITVINKPIA